MQEYARSEVARALESVEDSLSANDMPGETLPYYLLNLQKNYDTYRVDRTKEKIRDIRREMGITE